MYLEGIFSGLLLFGLQLINGLNENCNVSEPLIVPLGKIATFEAKSVYFGRFDRIQFSGNGKNIFVGRSRYFLDSFRRESIYFNSRMENRITIDVKPVNGSNDVNISLANLSTEDNGTYLLETGSLSQRYCWNLFIMDVRLTPPGPIMENSAARVYGNPPESLIRPLLNATMVWLVNGLTADQSAELLVFDGVLWNRNVGRHLHRRNVTYRALQDGGKIDEVNITLDVTYGPSPEFPLYFTPEDTYYTLESGEILPDISCHADCNPPCEVTWQKRSLGNTLRLGRVSAYSTGKYTCVAKGSLTTFSKSLYVQVVDTTHAPSPEFPVYFTPEDTYYTLKSGDSLPDISCHADCSPPCEVTWVNYSPDNTLRLGRVSAKTAGKYTCVAKSSLTTVSKSLEVHVIDEWSMVLSPSSTAYFLSAGDSMPDINCSALCFPPCNTTWNRESTGNILRFVDVRAEMSGEYVCTASRNDTSRQMEKRVMIFVKDDRSTKAALAVVGSIQALITVILGICSLLYYLREREMSCSDLLHQRHQQQRNKKRKDLEGKEVPTKMSERKDTVQEGYEELDLGQGKLERCDLAAKDQTKKEKEKTAKIYENTAIAQSSVH